MSVCVSECVFFVFLMCASLCMCVILFVVSCCFTVSQKKKKATIIFMTISANVEDEIKTTTSP